MWKSRDLALVIMLAVVSFIYSVFVGQLGNLLTGIYGLNFLFYIGSAIFISFGFLAYRGRRWRLLLQGMLVALLTLPTYFSGAPFDVLARIPMILNSLFADVVYNTGYNYFEKNHRLRWLSILLGVGFIVTSPFFVTLNIIEGAIGGAIAYQIFFKLEKEKRSL